MKFSKNAFGVFNDDWALLTAGKKDHYNTMTISWGGLGTLWGKPAVTVYVRPSRYTHQFMEEGDTFTVSFYPEACRPALSKLGELSGRDCDKVAAAGLNPEFLPEGVTFKEAVITLVCKKMFRQDMDPAAIPADILESRYKGVDPHTMYIGEVVEVISKEAE